jgi:hypothetical protein
MTFYTFYQKVHFLTLFSSHFKKTKEMSTKDLVLFLEKELQNRRIQYAIMIEETPLWVLEEAKRFNQTPEATKATALRGQNNVREALLKRYNTLNDILNLIKRENKPQASTAEERLLELKISHAARHAALGKLIIKGVMNGNEARLMTQPYLVLLEMFKTEVGEGVVHKVAQRSMF